MVNLKLIFNIPSFLLHTNPWANGKRAWDDKMEIAVACFNRLFRV